MTFDGYTRRFVCYNSRVPRPKTKRPTERELDILNVLWTRGDSTIRQIHSELAKTLDLNYNTILTFVRIMVDKGLVERDGSVRPQIFHAVVTRDQAQRTFVSFLKDRLFGGSTKSLVIRALSDKRSSKKETAELRKWLDEQQRKRK